MSHEMLDPHGVTSTTSCADNRRTWQRSLSSRPIPRRIYSVEDFRPLDAWMVDVSCGGVALFLTEPLAEGAILFIELEALPEAPPVKVWATVIRCKPADGGDWLLGCELMNRLSEQQLESLLV